MRELDTARSQGATLNFVRLAEAIDDARLVQIVGRHLELHAVAIGQADEAFAHRARDMGQDRMIIGVREGDSEHRAREHFSDFAFSFDDLFGHSESCLGL